MLIIQIGVIMLKIIHKAKTPSKMFLSTTLATQ